MAQYPGVTEYNEALQHPHLAFFDPELQAGVTETNALGLPWPRGGGFALTYCVITRSGRVAVRCFKQHRPTVEERYRGTASFLGRAKSDYFVPFDYQPRGMRIRGQAYPIVRMDWVSGQTLGLYLERHFTDRLALAALQKRLRELAGFLEQQGIAHGDLQNGNIMVLPSGSLKLIDYDGMHVPGLPISGAEEIGHPNFRHPLRSSRHYGPAVDRFSFIAIDLSLTALIEDPSLFPRFGEGEEAIIFKGNDYADPKSSDVFRLLRARPTLRQALFDFEAVCQAPIEEVPSLADFLNGRNIPRPVTVPGTAPSAYIAAFPVIEAAHYEAVVSQVGNRVELIGRVHSVHHGTTWKGDPYVFVNFGFWQHNIARITIWSQALAQFGDIEQPSPSWHGRWVSVTGLIDAPFMSHQHGYTHVGPTVTGPGQIRLLSDAEAFFRLGRQPTSTAPPAPMKPDHQDSERARREPEPGQTESPRPHPPSLPPQIPRTTPTGSRSDSNRASLGRIREILRDIHEKQVASNPPATGSAGQPSASSQPPPIVSAPTSMSTTAAQPPLAPRTAAQPVPVPRTVAQPAPVTSGLPAEVDTPASKDLGRHGVPGPAGPAPVRNVGPASNKLPRRGMSGCWTTILYLLVVAMLFVGFVGSTR